MKDNANISLILRGYTDAVGSETYNTMLSKFRADIAKNYLVSKGVDPRKITSVGKGAEHPIADNNDNEGRQANRRVEVEMKF